MFKRKINLSLYLSAWILIALSGCNSYQKILNSTDYEYKFTRAKEFYNSGDYGKALPIFEELMTVWRGQKNVEAIYYHYAYSHYCLHDYTTAGYYFKNFTEFYPNSAWAEDASYMVGQCHYEMSPPISLDQTETQKAIDALQIFANTYPASTRLEKSNGLITILRHKLERKAYETANLYYKLKRYKSAATAFKNLLNEFPDTPLREEAMYLTTKSYFLLAENSIETKRKERYDLAVNAYLDFIDNFPQSKYLRDAENIYETSNKYLKKTE